MEKKKNMKHIQVKTKNNNNNMRTKENNRNISYTHEFSRGCSGTLGYTTP